MTIILSNTEENDGKPKSDAEYQAEIERLKTERAQADAQRVAEERQSQEHIERIRQHNFDTALKASQGMSGIRFHVTELEEMKKLLPLSGYKISSSQSGSVVAMDEHGKLVPAVKVFEELAKRHPYLVADGSADHLLPKRNDDGQFRTLSKSDFKTTAAKAQAIREKTEELGSGKAALEWWESLPLYPVKSIPADIAKLGRADWSRMSATAKSEVIATWGGDIVSEIMKRP